MTFTTHSHDSCQEAIHEMLIRHGQYLNREDILPIEEHMWAGGRTTTKYIATIATGAQNHLHDATIDYNPKGSILKTCGVHHHKSL